jgi:hypothetical protein
LTGLSGEGGSGEAEPAAGGRLRALVLGLEVVEFLHFGLADVAVVETTADDESRGRNRRAGLELEAEFQSLATASWRRARSA